MVEVGLYFLLQPWQHQSRKWHAAADEVGGGGGGGGD